MIKSIRVDYRLLHGQVAVSWTASLGADCLLLVSDTVKNDPLRLNALKMAKPSGTKVVVKNTAEAVEALKSGGGDCQALNARKLIIVKNLYQMVTIFTMVVFRKVRIVSVTGL